MVPFEYAHPQDVLLSDLDTARKRQLLAAWASDANVVEGRPKFRWLPGTPGPILIDHVLKAMCDLDDDELRNFNDARFCDSIIIAASETRTAAASARH